MRFALKCLWALWAHWHSLLVAPVLALALTMYFCSFGIHAYKVGCFRCSQQKQNPRPTHYVDKKKSAKYKSKRSEVLVVTLKNTSFSSDDWLKQWFPTSRLKLIALICTNTDVL